ncbi:flagellar biosynthesis anti-sigma factor FlgM [Spirobacillus cienkowskii]|jgi:negative regulator of flagellin synthesis FlgM|uniref:Negative regulator of flagellin synthesis n=1 Tax=Spirobacillus cienkowskii TaxID=495820 RepID=A0A369KTR7_9BACT|nr:MAG: flagellar biosynthesis anti-sigma factor FlgM [Spirobacillus cienkowskii]
MSINNVKNSPSIINPNANQTSEATKPDRINTKKGANAYAKANQPPSLKDAANVQISQRAKELSMAKKIAEETPDIREEKVAQFKDKLNKGEYKVDAEKVADAILRETFKDEVAKEPETVLS